MIEVKRMWINAPSTAQAHHDLHGTNVLALYEEGSATARVYFLSGPVVSQRVYTSQLSAGWK